MANKYKEYSKNYYIKNRNKILERMRNSRQRKIYMKEYTDKNKDKISTYGKVYYRKHAQEQKDYENNRNKQRRYVVLCHYGGNPPKCACCGENTIEFLSIDHVNNDGFKHRKLVGGGSSLNKWLVKHNFPIGFQILCHNCNCAKGFYGKCPHMNRFSRPDSEMNASSNRGSELSAGR
jgi:hypothetical protein